MLVVWIIRGFSLMRAGMVGILACLACDVINYFVDKPDFLNLRQLWDCCIDGAKQAAALPTVAAYLVGVILFVPCIQPILLQSGLPDATANLCANMFVFYYGIMAQITPPVCVASYTAAGIAGGDAMKTGLKGFTFAMVGFLVPFVFVYNPPLLLKGTWAEIAVATLQLALGTYFLAIMVAGFFRNNLNAFERTILFVAALCLIAPEMISSIVGAVLGIAILFISGRKTKGAAA